MITLQMVMNSRVPTVLNLCPTDPMLLTYVNEAEERLMTSPENWVGSWQRALFDLYDGFCVYPRGVVEIRQAKVCGTPMVLRNEWYSYLGPVGQPDYSDQTGCYLAMEADGTTPVYSNISRSGNRARAYPGDPSDVGKRLLIQGTDKNGVWVRTQDMIDPANPVWVDGEYLTLALPFVDSQTQWAEAGITGVQREITNKSTALFESNFDTQIESPMADYQPDEIVPSYRKSRILHFGSNQRSCSGSSYGGSPTPYQIDCIIRLAHVPVRQPQDYFVLNNLPALKDASMAIKMDEDAGPGAGAAYMASAIRLLRQELKNFTGSRVHIKADLHGGKQFGYMVRGMR